MIETLAAVPTESEALGTDTSTFRVETQNELGEALQTTVYAVRLSRAEWQPRLVMFDEPTRLLDHSEAKGIHTAMTAGYDLNHGGIPLGMQVVDGKLQKPYVEIGKGQGKVRGAVHFGDTGKLAIDQRGKIIKQLGPIRKVPKGHVIQAGPVLVRNGLSVIERELDVAPEGFDKTKEQFAPPPTYGRHPRTAFGFDGEDMWAVVTDGRKEGEAGLTIREMSEVMVRLGALYAINMDGGSSTTLIHTFPGEAGPQLLNDPRGEPHKMEDFSRGQWLMSAIIFEKRMRRMRTHIGDVALAA